jgi:hypothetical protein
VSIYVEILIRASMQSLWEHTQTPALHERWDLRFSTIDYLANRSDFATRHGSGSASMSAEKVKP